MGAINKNIKILLPILLCTIVLLSAAPVPPGLEEQLKTTQGTGRLKILGKLTYKHRQNSPQKALNYSFEAMKLFERFKNEKLKGVIYKNMAHAYRVQGKFTQALKYGNLSVEMAVQTGYTLLEADAIIGMANLHHSQGNYDKATKLYVKALKLYRKKKSVAGLAIIYNNLGLIHMDRDNYPKALEYLIKGGECYGKVKDQKNVATVYSNVGILYRKMGDSARAEENYNKALEIYRKNKYLPGIATCYTNIAVIYSGKDDAKSMGFNLKALEIRKKLNDQRSIALLTNNIGLNQQRNKKIDLALKSYLEALRIRREFKDKLGITHTLRNIGGIYKVKKEYKKALKYLTFALEKAKSVKSKSLVSGIHLDIALIYVKLNDYKNAFVNYRKYSNKKLTLFNNKDRKKISSIESRLKTELKDKEIELLKKDNQIQKLEIGKFNVIRNSFIGIFIFILLLLIGLYSRFRLKRKMNTLLEEKNKQMQVSNDKLTESEAHLNELNVTKDKFFSIIAHDLKNPLNSVISTSELLLESLKTMGPERAERFIKSLNKSSRHLYALLENLLQWARSHSKRITFEPERLNLYSLVEDNVELLSQVAQNKSIDLKMDIDRSIGIFVDRNMIMTVMRNLISNGLKFTQPEGSVTISAQEEDDFIEVSVCDTGVGISPEDKQKLFRLDSGFSKMGTDGEKGTGLGLIVCKEFIEKNGGKIGVENGEPGGTVFSFTVPKDRLATSQYAIPFKKKTDIIRAMMDEEINRGNHD